MNDREQAVELLRLAERDLRALKGMCDANTFAEEIFGFVAQQAVEKSLKAWLALLVATYPFTHDLTDLLSRLEDSGQDVSESWQFADLNPFAVQLRYGGAVFDDMPLDRSMMIGQVEELIDRVKQAIEGGR